MRAGELREIVSLVSLATGTAVEALPAIKAAFAHLSGNGGSATIEELRAVVADAKARHEQIEAEVAKGRGVQEPTPKRAN